MEGNSYFVYSLGIAQNVVLLIDVHNKIIQI